MLVLMEQHKKRNEGIADSMNLRIRMSNSANFPRPVFDQPHYQGSPGHPPHTAGPALALLILGISAAVVIIALSLALLFCRNSSKFRVFNAPVSKPVPPTMEEPHLRITRKDLQIATANFSDRNLIGRGNFSAVYKGILPGGQVVAVKWMQLDDPNLARQNFFAELEILGRLRHRNLLKILGYFWDSEDMALILEFMARGSLEYLLHGEGGCPLDWRQRLKIAIGVARGLVYLHHESRTCVVHCDLQPSNILLDGDLEAHIADFGVAKILCGLHAREGPIGPTWSIGYTAPERAYHGQATSKSDVYSFGIILLELITRQRPASCNFEFGSTLVEWMHKAEAEDYVLHVIDKHLKSEVKFHSEILDVVNLALLCSQEVPIRRPTIKEVEEALLRIEGGDGQSQRFNVPLHVLLASPSTNTPLQPNNATPSTTTTS